MPPTRFFLRVCGASTLSWVMAMRMTLAVFGQAKEPVHTARYDRFLKLELGGQGTRRCYVQSGFGACIRLFPADAYGPDGQRIFGAMISSHPSIRRAMDSLRDLCLPRMALEMRGTTRAMMVGPDMRLRYIKTQDAA